MVAAATGTFGPSRRGCRTLCYRWMTSVSAHYRGPVPTILRRPEARLFLTATSVLFVELLLIRWIPANVIYVGFFRNFLLMATLPRHRRRHPAGAATRSASTSRRSGRCCSRWSCS